MATKPSVGVIRLCLSCKRQMDRPKRDKNEYCWICDDARKTQAKAISQLDEEYNAAYRMHKL